MFLLYNFLLTLASPIWVPWMILRARARKEQPNWKERMGDSSIEPPRDGVRRVWIHAVSVGEVIAVLPILRELRNKMPNHQIVFSVTTSSGHSTAQDKAAGLYDHLIYFPIDVARFQLAAMTRVRPDVVAIMETELWMNFLWAAKAMDAKTLLINGRISDRSFPRARRVKFFYRALLRDLDLALMQSDKDAERIRTLGAAKAEVLGNCKFDEAAEEVKIDRQELGISPKSLVIVVGSTRGEEDERLVLDALEEVKDLGALIIHAPRHLERADELALDAAKRFGEVRRRSEALPLGHCSYLLLDTYGELAKIYAIADVAIVGGGFANLGGQNLIQPLAHGVPALHGPHMQNFREATAEADSVGAAIQCADSAELAATLRRLLTDPHERQKMGSAASAMVQRHRGASARYAQAIADAAGSGR